MTNKMRKLYFAPMEGITGYIFRNTFHEFFSGADKYYTPFLAPNQNEESFKIFFLSIIGD